MQYLAKPEPSPAKAKFWLRLVCATFLATGSVIPVNSAVAQTADSLEKQRAQYDAVQAKSIIELQPFRRETTVLVPDTGGQIRWISLNPHINSGFLLEIPTPAKRRKTASYHIENPDPTGTQVSLVADPVATLVLTDAKGAVACAPWAGDKNQLDQGSLTRLAFSPICDGRLYLRNKVSGSATAMERTTEFLRDKVWGGEEIVRFVRDNFFKDSQLETSEELPSTGIGWANLGPGAAAVDGDIGARPMIATHTALRMAGVERKRMAMGIWYPVKGISGVYGSAIQPRAISKEIFNGPGKTNRLDGVESRAIDYFVAFDLGLFDVGYALGTDHPALGWSPRPPASVRPRGMPGPDGVNSANPLVPVGMISPAYSAITAATFAGGFKRHHGAFRAGEYATINYGTHYGFIENGVIYSKLQPNLSTFYVLADGTIKMKTWTEADNDLLPMIKSARQNGVPLLETDGETGLGVPGALVTQWGPGNWSGSADADLRTVRAGVCIRYNQGKRYLVYGYFSTATPSAMARTFQAYGCAYAMELDMNALEHTYIALYVRHEDAIQIEHIVPGMGLVDKKGRKGDLIPRWLGYADNRDFFYLTRRKDVK